MKGVPISLLLFCSISFISCGNNENKTGDILVKDKAALPPQTLQKDNDIVGEWEQVHTILDKDGDNQLSTAERKTPSPQLIGDYFLRFNKDGSCTYSDMEMEGSYEVRDNKNKKTIYIHGADPRRLRILSLTNSEMVLMPSNAPGTFLLYKRK